MAKIDESVQTYLQGNITPKKINPGAAETVVKLVNNKSPSDTTIYRPALNRISNVQTSEPVVEGGDMIQRISNFIESIRREQNGSEMEQPSRECVVQHRDRQTG